MSMNKRIAELRGEREETCLYMDECDCGASLGHPCSDYTPKPYDTDIACAMELWEEMKGAGLSPVLGEHEGTIFCDIRETSGKVGGRKPRHLMRMEANTEAEAIAGAWLKWKEAP